MADIENKPCSFSGHGLFFVNLHCEYILKLMLMKHLFLTLAVLPALFLEGCETVDHTGEHGTTAEMAIPLDDVARLLSALPLENEQMQEVHDAVSSSDGNGYDEEYRMTDLFVSPGAGVGTDEATRATKAGSYARPMKDLIAEYLSSRSKSGQQDAVPSPEEYMEALKNSDIQIYWPYSENWDDKDWPVITFDPGNGAEVNTGYRIYMKEDGSKAVEEVIVDEEMAASGSVWVVNRNTDSGYTSMEMRRRENPEWGTGGGVITIRPQGSAGTVKSLVMKDFKMRRNYDCWFAGASEFFVKCGSVEDFTASTEAELKLYSPKITDFMLVVKRSQTGLTIPLNVMLVSQWTDQLEDIAFMVTEDDGGTRTEWKCSATVKVKSKSYGFDIALPFNTRDDIVWRGSLSAAYMEKYDGMTNRFGDVDITFSFLER